MRKIISVIAGLMVAMCLTPCSFAGTYTTDIDSFSYNGYSIPGYDGDSVETVNGNTPKFTKAEKKKKATVAYGNTDSKGRCTAAFAGLNQSLMPTGKRGSISSVYPTGWVQEKYDLVPGKYLYNRCHLIGWQLTGADLNNLTKEELTKDLITGTRYLNVGDGKDGMVGYENEVASYLKASDSNYVAYRVTPIFQGENLLASGVLMEGQSLNDNSVKFCVFCYNVQPGIAIDYATGKSVLASTLNTVKPVGECTIKVKETKVEYTGKSLKPSVTIKDGNTKLKKNTDYKVSYTNNILPGKAKVQIVGTGNYKGASVKYFYISPDRAVINTLTAKKGGFKVTLAGNTGATGYKYAYRVKNGDWQYVSSKSESKGISNLKRKTTYQVKSKAYVKVNGKRYYGKWSVSQKIKTK